MSMENNIVNKDKKVKSDINILCTILCVDVLKRCISELLKLVKKYELRKLTWKLLCTESPTCHYP